MTSSQHRYDSVVLGFAEPAPSSAFAPSRFTSKAGGLPVWLYRSQDSPPPAPRCPICLQKQRFLLQVYAPIEPPDIPHDAAFHRVLYVAICPAAPCQKAPNCATVLRAQLPRRNPYYPFDAGAENGAEADAKAAEAPNTCVLCGFKAAKRCGRCQGKAYCGRACQLADWKLGHKGECKGTDKAAVEEAQRKREGWRYKEWEIVTEGHPTPPSSDDDDDDEDDSDRDHDGPVDTGAGAVANQGAGRDKKKDVPNASAGNGASGELRGTFQDADADELPEDLFRGRAAAGRPGWTERFRRVVSYAGGQVVRYDRGGEELWAGHEGRCSEPGECERCGADMVFEMQVMPQLAWFLAGSGKGGAKGGGGGSIGEVARRLREDMEWDTVAVYSCARSCTSEDGGDAEEYVYERAWVQSIDGNSAHE